MPQGFVFPLSFHAIFLLLACIVAALVLALVVVLMYQLWKKRGDGDEGGVQRKKTRRGVEIPKSASGPGTLIAISSCFRARVSAHGYPDAHSQPIDRAPKPMDSLSAKPRCPGPRMLDEETGAAHLHLACPYSHEYGSGGGVPPSAFPMPYPAPGWPPLETRALPFWNAPRRTPPEMPSPSPNRVHLEPSPTAYQVARLDDEFQGCRRSHPNPCHPSLWMPDLLPYSSNFNRTLDHRVLPRFEGQGVNNDRHLCAFSDAPGRVVERHEYCSHNTARVDHHAVQVAPASTAKRLPKSVSEMPITLTHTEKAPVHLQEVRQYAPRGASPAVDGDSWAATYGSRTSFSDVSATSDPRTLQYVPRGGWPQQPPCPQQQCHDAASSHRMWERRGTSHHHPSEFNALSTTSDTYAFHTGLAGLESSSASPKELLPTINTMMPAPRMSETMFLPGDCDYRLTLTDDEDHDSVGGAEKQSLRRDSTESSLPTCTQRRDIVGNDSLPGMDAFGAPAQPLGLVAAATSPYREEKALRSSRLERDDELLDANLFLDPSVVDFGKKSSSTSSFPSTRVPVKDAAVPMVHCRG